MKSKIKELVLLVCALCALGLIPVFLSKDNPIEVQIPSLNAEEMAAKEAQQRASAQASAAKAKVRRMFRCEMSEDCIIVDQDPCGCLVGPEGVVAINAQYTLEFNRLGSNLVAKACPEGEPSVEKECSPEAEAVCLEGVCKIAY